MYVFIIGLLDGYTEPNLTYSSIRLGDLYKYKAKERYLKATLIPIGYDKDIRPPGIENAGSVFL